MKLEAIRKSSLLLGLVGAVGCGIGFLTHREMFFAGYLNAFGFWLAISLGALGMLLLHRLTGGYWGDVAGPVMRAALKALPLLAVGLVPILFFAGDIYPWVPQPDLPVSALIESKRAWLNIPGFIGRSVFYFAVWFFFARFVAKAAQGENRQLGRAGVGVLLFSLTVSFAAFDWFMSLEPEWFSSIYGGLLMIGSVMGILATSILFLHLAKVELPEDRWHDLGKLLLMSVMVWAYFNFSQYLIIWSAKIPEEMTWYHHRTDGGLKYLGFGLVLFHFAVPFMILLSRSLKRRGSTLSKVAVGLLIMRFFDFLWWTQPAFRPNELIFPTWSLVAMLALGGFWLHIFTKAFAVELQASGRTA